MLDTSLRVVQYSKAVQEAYRKKEEEEEEEWEDAFDEEEIVGDADFYQRRIRDDPPARCWYEDETQTHHKVGI